MATSVGCDGSMVNGWGGFSAGRGKGGTGGYHAGGKRGGGAVTEVSTGFYWLWHIFCFG
jgi:hypothetical protein